jgi:signal transduction histidine kinase/CheY-like chemotaxis protein
MNLKTKTTAVLGAMLTTLLLVLYVVSGRIIQSGFLRLEQRYASNNVARVLGAIEASKDDLDGQVADWARWDDMYAFVLDRNRPFIESSLPDACRTLKMQALLIVDTLGNVVWKEGFDLVKSEPAALPPGLIRLAGVGFPLTRFAPDKPAITGIVLLEEGPMIVASRPIIPSLGTGPAHGTLIMGRFLDRAELDRLDQVFQLRLSTFRADSLPSTPFLRETLAALSQGQPYRIHPVNDSILMTYGLLRDLDNRPAVLFESQLPRDILQQGRHTIAIFMSMLMLVCLFFSAAILLMLRQHVLVRLEHLSHDISRITLTEDFSRQIAVPGSDELSAMAGDINRLLATFRQARHAVEQANRAKSVFLANMSHEIRTPLNGIMGFAQIIAKSKDVDRREQKQAEQITAECSKLLELVNLILDLAKIEAGKMEIEARPFSLRALLGDLTSAFNAGAAEKNIGFAVVIQEEVHDGLIGDALRVRQVLTNLVGNAIKFTREGGVSVTVGSSEENGNQVRLTFRVIDTGIGIAPEKLGLIFESFTQADGATTREYGGSGLGTTICKQLVELMGGEIGVESAIGKGSAFWFTVPFEKGSLAMAAESAPETERPPASFPNVRVLVVEDYPTNQAIVRYLIESAGGVVAVAENGLVALEVFSERDFDIILMDVQMPKMDGYEATREIRKLPRGATIPIIGMTANVFEKDRQACLAAGMNDFIPKPFELRQFHDVVARWLAPASAGPPRH